MVLNLPDCFQPLFVEFLVEDRKPEIRFAATPLEIMVTITRVTRLHSVSIGGCNNNHYQGGFIVGIMMTTNSIISI